MELSKTGRKVLIVDDMPTILKQAVEMIGDRYEIDTASSGAEAIEKLGEVKPDIILLDMNMPDMNGISCMEEIHAIPGFADTPVILTANEVSIMWEARAYDKGAADFLKKPFIPANLFRKIDMHIKLSEIGWHFEP